MDLTALPSAAEERKLLTAVMEAEKRFRITKAETMIVTFLWGSGADRVDKDFQIAEIFKERTQRTSRTSYAHQV